MNFEEERLTKEDEEEVYRIFGEEFGGRILENIEKVEYLKERIDNMLDKDKLGLLTDLGLVALEVQIMARANALLGQNLPLYVLIDIDNFK